MWLPAVLSHEGVAWEAHLKRAMLARAAEHPPDVLLVTAPPFSMVTQGVRFARRLGVPLVLDMRDPWSTWVLDPHATYAHYRITLAVEDRCFKAASDIVLNSEETREDMRRLHPSVPARKFHVITNGYSTDVDSFAVPPVDIQAKRFTIGYVGSFYYLPAARERMMSTWRIGALTLFGRRARLDLPPDARLKRACECRNGWRRRHAHRPVRGRGWIGSTLIPTTSNTALARSGGLGAGSGSSTASSRGICLSGEADAFAAIPTPRVRCG